VGEGIMKLEELQVYQLSMDLGERVWEIVIEWDYFAKDTIGKQFVKAVDSVAANLSEGFGRYYYKENKQFCYYSRGSLHETLTWLTKAKNRGLINVEDFDSIRKDVDTIGLKLNNYIKSIGPKKITINDSEAK
jgi:four helix bundle protein